MNGTPKAEAKASRVVPSWTPKLLTRFVSVYRFFLFPSLSPFLSFPLYYSNPSHSIFSPFFSFYPFSPFSLILTFRQTNRNRQTDIDTKTDTYTRTHTRARTTLPCQVVQGCFKYQ